MMMIANLKLAVFILTTDSVSRRDGYAKMRSSSFTSGEAVYSIIGRRLVLQPYFFCFQVFFDLLQVHIGYVS